MRHGYQNIFLILLSCFLICVVGIKTIYHKTTMDIFFVSDDGYVPHMGTAIASILFSAAEDEEFNIYILHSSISDENKRKLEELKKIKPFNLEFIYVNVRQFKNFKLSRTSLETYYKFIVPTVKPHLKKALYLDSDIVVLGSLKDLWNTDVSNTYLAAPDGGVNGANKLKLARYFNAGVLLFNSQKIRDDHKVEELMERTIPLHAESTYWLEDQDVFNVVFADNTMYLDDKYNWAPEWRNKWTSKSLEEEGAVVIHYVGFKPWQQKVRNDDIYWRIRDKTPWRTDKRPR